MPNIIFIVVFSGSIFDITNLDIFHLKMFVPYVFVHPASSIFSTFKIKQAIKKVSSVYRKWWGSVELISINYTVDFRITSTD